MRSLNNNNAIFQTPRFIKRFKKNKGLFLLSLPGIIVIFVFCYLPLYGLVLPFKNYNFSMGIIGSPWVGLKNFDFIFGSKAIFQATFNTVMYNGAFIVTGTIIAVGLALMLNEISGRAIKVYQTTMFLPYFISWVIVSYISLALLNMDSGAINGLLQFFGAEPILWYNEPKYWPAILIIANIWKGAGYSCIIYYSVLIGIDPSLYEAADMEGATKIQKIKFISIPLLTPLISLLTILAIGRIFYGNFDMFYNLPRNSALLQPTTDVIDTYVFRALRMTGDVGMASAAGFYQSVVGFCLVMATNYIFKKISSDNAIF